jgi:RNA polymerase sigma-32 factor
MTISDRAVLSTYRANVARRAEPLSRQAEQELAFASKNGDRAATRRLIEGCLSAVIAIALEYRHSGLPIEDLVQEGNIGLLKATERFDPERGVRLGTYAALWIRAEIREYVARHYRVVQLGNSKAERRALWLYRRTREERPEALAAMSGLSTERARALLPVLIARDVSLTAPSDDGPSLVERLADGTESAEVELGDLEERARLQSAVEAAVSELSARDQDIARRRLFAEEPATLEELGATWDVSRERVRQLGENVKGHLRRRLEELGDEYGLTTPLRRSA